MQDIDYTVYYSKWHPPTQEHRDSMAIFYAKLLKAHLGDLSGLSILDVGCGMGFAMLACKALGCNSAQGIDIDRGQYELALANGLEVTHTADPLIFLENHQEEYDLLLCMDVIEHIDVSAQLQFCQAMRSAIKPQGRLLCTVPNANSSFASRWRYNDWTHRSSFTEHSLEFLLVNAGFQKPRVVGMEFMTRPRCAWFPTRGTRHWWTFNFFRALRRLEAMAELGPTQGRLIPLSLNLLAVTER